MVFSRASHCSRGVKEVIDEDSESWSLSQPRLHLLQGRLARMHRRRALQSLQGYDLTSSNGRSKYGLKVLKIESLAFRFHYVFENEDEFQRKPSAVDEILQYGVSMAVR